MPLLKSDRFGNIYEASPLRDDGMGIGRMPCYADETDVALSGRDPKTEFARKVHQKNLEKAKALRQLHRERQQRKKDYVERVSKLKTVAAQRKAAKAIKAKNDEKAAIFKRAMKQPTMGYDFDPLIGDPLEGFGGGIKLKKPKFSAPKISLPKVPVPKFISKAVADVGKAAGAISKLPAQAVDKTVKQVGGSKLVNFLDRTTGGTYTQAIKVGQLPGKAMEGKAITKEDQQAALGLALKAATVAATVYGAQGIVGAASNMVQQAAAKELAKKVGGSAGALVAGAVDLYSNGPEAALKTVAQKETERVAVKEASKKLGKEAGNILSIGSAAYSGGGTAAVAKTQDIAKDKAIAEAAKKTGLPVGIVAAVSSGNVPSPTQVKESIKQELIATPARLQEQLKTLPQQIAAAPAKTKVILQQKQEAIKKELQERDKVVVDLAKKHAEELAKADAKIKEASKKTDEKLAELNKAKADLEKLKKDPKITSTQIAVLSNKVQQKQEEVVKADAKTVIAVAEKENADAIMEAKKVSAANGLFGVRMAIPVQYQHPIFEWMEKAKKISKG